MTGVVIVYAFILKGLRAHSSDDCFMVCWLNCFELVINLCWFWLAVQLLMRFWGLSERHWLSVWSRYCCQSVKLQLIHSGSELKDCYIILS